MTVRTRGLLIALEGIDGAGKSTLKRRLVARLRADGLRVAGWHEPTDPGLGRKAQALGPNDPWGAAMCFTLDRLLARPQLERLLRTHDVVVADRSFYSTLAYQGSALPAARARRLVQLETGASPGPDRVLWLRLEPGLALARVGTRGYRRAPLERRRILVRVHRAYARLARRHGFVVLDARAPAPDLLARALRVVAGARRRRPRAAGRQRG